MSENKDNPVSIQEIQTLREEISLMHNSLAHDVVMHAPLVQKTVDLFIDKGIDRRWVETLLAPLVDSAIEDDEVMLLAYVLEELDNLITIKEESTALEQKIVLMVGATGIGKTSLIGKLGARYKYQFKDNYSVAYINFDERKVGAVEQLAHYADAMDIPLVPVEKLNEEMYHRVLIDSSGNGGEYVDELQALIQILKECSSYKIEVSLVLSATSKLKDMNSLLDVFKVLSIDNFIFTKLDETSDLSDMINFLIKEKIPLSYLSIGQKIPEDLELASKEYILNKFMNE